MPHGCRMVAAARRVSSVYWVVLMVAGSGGVGKSQAKTPGSPHVRRKRMRWPGWRVMPCCFSWATARAAGE